MFQSVNPEVIGFKQPKFSIFQPIGRPKRGRARVFGGTLYRSAMRKKLSEMVLIGTVLCRLCAILWFCSHSGHILRTTSSMALRFSTSQYTHTHAHTTHRATHTHNSQKPHTHTHRHRYTQTLRHFDTQKGSHTPQTETQTHTDTHTPAVVVVMRTKIWNLLVILCMISERRMRESRSPVWAFSPPLSSNRKQQRGRYTLPYCTAQHW